MKIELCDLCRRDVSKEPNVTKVIIKDWNGYEYDHGCVFRSPRKWRGVICDECLKKLRDAVGENSNEEAD